VRKTIIAGNWKMHKTFAEAKEFMDSFLSELSPTLESRVLLAPSFPLLASMVDWAKDSPLEIGVQNIHDKEQGAFTGEVSAKLVQGMGATFTLVGHSERRHYFHEEGHLIRKKIQRALAVGLEPILCIGETLEEREAGQMQSTLERQVKEALEGFSHEEVSKIVIAYEPVWAIGTGKHATPEIAEEAHAFCRELILKGWGEALASSLSILYGGSVNAGNVKVLMDQENIDGVLVGGASLEPSSFLQIIGYNQ
jgi:triosephosphate isomerase (TIM)